MMKNDHLITLTPSDGILAPASKYDAHRFNPATPKGMVHRAFSVFLFDETNKMLITKRAESKITFPGVWTNTCCSHPLFGQSPDEVDDNSPDKVKDRGGLVTEGTRQGAVRKLKHELGVTAVDVDDMAFLTRFHYWAADVLTYGTKEPQWGEHEIDYVFFAKKRREEVEMELNVEEVDEVKWVSQSELKSMMTEEGSKWSPWFAGIMERKGWSYWSSLDGIVEAKGEGFGDLEVHKFDPPKEYFADFHHGEGKEE